MLLSVVISFRNEEACLKELIRRLQVTLQALRLSYELIFVNDASTDRSLEILKEENKADKGVKVITMSRPFGSFQCIMAGLKYARGSQVVYMDADLQDPPELIPEMLKKLQEGADVVYTTRFSREGESWAKQWLTKWGYRLLKFFSEINLPLNAGDFKLISRKVVDELIQLHENYPFVKGLVTWVGFKQVPVFYHREKRFAGKTHFSILSKGSLKNFIHGMTSFSSLPLGWVSLLSFVFSMFLFLFLMAALILSHPSSLLLATLLLGGIQLLVLSTMGIYLVRVFEEVKHRPNYIVESTMGFSNPQLR